MMSGRFLSVVSALLMIAGTASARTAYDMNQGIVSPFRTVAEKVVPAVVSVEVTRTMNHPELPGFRFHQMFPREGIQEQEVPGSGSGFLIDGEGYVLTNNHVVAGATELKIRLAGHDEALSAELVGSDPDTDLALLRIDDPSKRKYPYLTLGDSDEAHVGDWAVAVGNPLGELEGTLTVGVISAKGRSELDIRGGAPRFQDFIQTDAAINFGNSGGPLVDIQGRVIGINAAMNAGSEGIGFAIPVNLAKRVLRDLRIHGNVERAFLGVAPKELDTHWADYYGSDLEKGILIARVSPGEPADRAGLLAGDVLVEFDGEELGDLNHFRLLVAGKDPGDKVKIRYFRDGEFHDKKVKLARFPESESGRTTPALKKASPDHFAGMRVRSLPPSSNARANEEGVFVVSVEDKSPAKEAGLLAGDRLVEMSSPQFDISIVTMDDYTEAASRLSLASAIRLRIERSGRETYLLLDLNED